MIIFLLIKFYLAIALSLFIPGHFFAKTFLGQQQKSFSTLEWLLISFGSSLIITNFLVLLMNFFSLKITALSTATVLSGFSLLFYFLSRNKKAAADEEILEIKPNSFKKFANRKFALILGIIILSCVIRVFYTADGIVPRTTDLGHHIYWSKTISETGQLPNYGMPDFIIGEHIIFAVVQLLSGFSYISAMPVAILFLVNIFSLIATSLCAYYLVLQFGSKKNAGAAAIFTLLIAGLFYATSSPQAKFIAGGVIGNMIGNLFIPLAIYLFLLAIKNKDPRAATLFYLSLAGLGFTHHLSTFIFLYVFTGFLVIFFLLSTLVYRFNLSKMFADVLPYIKVFLSKWNLFALFAIICFMLFVHMPSYLNKSAIDTAVGAPSKSTRVGLPIGAIILSVGAWKFFYALLGVIALGIVFIKKLRIQVSEKTVPMLVSVALAFAWFFIIFLMSTKPGLLKVDIISSRIVSYITFPLSILSAFFVAFVFRELFRKSSPLVAQTIFFLVIGTGMISGFADISDSVRNNNAAEERAVIQTYKAAEYLNGVAKNDENVLKDHIYLEGDTWMKLFFMKDYTYPLSRSFLMRYEDPIKQRETCTRDMIAIPHSEIGKQCFKETGVSYVVLKKGFDTAQFEKSADFSKIYTSSNVVIYQRTNEK